MVEQRNPAILVVDDEQDICRNLADILEDVGYHVDTAFSGEAALEMIRRRPYQVALLDLKMPGMDGLTLYRHIRQEQAGTVVLIVTAYASSQVTQEALQAGAWQVLSKPVDLSHLMALVGDAVNQPVVMVIDDDVELCDNLWDLLRGHGFRVHLAHSQWDAEAQLAEHDCQVVLVDLKLPEGDGRRILEVLAARFPEVRSVLITGHREEWDLDTNVALSPVVDAICFKPFDIAQLLETIEQLANRGR